MASEQAEQAKEAGQTSDPNLTDARPWFRPQCRCEDGRGRTCSGMEAILAQKSSLETVRDALEGGARRKKLAVVPTRVGWGRFRYTPGMNGDRVLLPGRDPGTVVQPSPAARSVKGFNGQEGWQAFGKDKKGRPHVYHTEAVVAIAQVRREFPAQINRYEFKHMHLFPMFPMFLTMLFNTMHGFLGCFCSLAGVREQKRVGALLLFRYQPPRRALHLLFL